MTTTEEIATGRCLCGAARFEARGRPLWIVHCHCESCRRHTASPATTFAGYRAEQVTFTSSDTRRLFASSPGVQRSFCTRCGSPLSYAGESFPGEIHLFVALFDRPEQLAPQRHAHYAERLPWLHLDEHLPHGR